MMHSIRMRDGNWIQTKVVGTGPQYVVMVHGIGGHSNSWLPFALPFLKDFTFLIPNLRGYGQSEETPFTNHLNVLEQYADDLSDLISAMVPADEKVILCGLSMGAYLSMAYLHKYGTDKVIRYLNVDQTAKAINNDEWKHGLCGDKQDVLLPRFEGLMNQMDGHIGKPFEYLPEELREEYFQCMAKFFEMAFHRSYEKFIIGSGMKYSIPAFLHSVSARRWESYYYCLMSYIKNDYDFRETMRNLDIPVVCHIGNYSEMYPAAGQYEIANTAKNGTAIGFNESHGLMYTAPIAFTKCLKDFLYM